MKLISTTIGKRVRFTLLLAKVNGHIKEMNKMNTILMKNVFIHLSESYSESYYRQLLVLKKLSNYISENVETNSFSFARIATLSSGSYMKSTRLLNAYLLDFNNYDLSKPKDQHVHHRKPRLLRKFVSISFCSSSKFGNDLAGKAFFLAEKSRGLFHEKMFKIKQIFRRYYKKMEKVKGDLLKSVTNKKERKVIKTETNREVVRFQFEIDPEFWKSLEFYQELGRIPTKRELLNNALSLFKWAAKHKERGHSIVALDSSGKEYELELPCLDSIEVNSKQKQLRLVS
jgi:hypothetical protein